MLKKSLLLLVLNCLWVLRILGLRWILSMGGRLRRRILLVTSGWSRVLRALGLLWLRRRRRMLGRGSRHRRGRGMMRDRRTRGKGRVPMR